jgi:hypothetical protein
MVGAVFPLEDATVALPTMSSFRLWNGLRLNVWMAPSSFPTRRFPPPWTLEENNDACFIGKDATGQALAYFYFGDEPGPVKSGNLCAASHSAAALCI